MGVANRLPRVIAGIALATTIAGFTLAHCASSSQGFAGQPSCPLCDDAGYCLGTIDRGTCRPQLSYYSECEYETTWFCVDGGWCECGGNDACSCQASPAADADDRAVLDSSIADALSDVARRAE